MATATSTSTSTSSPFPFPGRRPPEDTVFFAIYPSLPSDLPAAAAISALQSLHLQIQALLSPHLSTYVFHHDPFALSLPTSLTTPCSLCSSPPLPHLHGKLRFGDSLPDEWLVVAILFFLTKSIPSLAARVWDSDGEFLLIEAAFSLPRWLSPDAASNRVFIHRGDLHIVPKSLSLETPSLQDALAAVRDGAADTRASDAVQSAIQRRINGLPENAAAQNMHRVKVIVPAPVAQVLRAEPCLIAAAVEAFYDRDIDTMKHAARMERFLKCNGEEGVEMVRVAVTMSRAMYGQLVQQNFLAPRCYPMPRRDEGVEAWVEAELGMKLACGFEMMYQERRRAGEEGKGSTWEAFTKSLEASGCFQGLLPGSKDYKRVMEEALRYYKSTALFSRTRDILSAPVCRIDEILSMPYSAEDFKGVDLPPNDDDSWLYNGEDELNAAILERQKEMEEYEAGKKRRKSLKQKVSNSGSSSQSNQFNLGEITESMQEFVRKISSFEGAEVPQNRDSKSVELDVDQFFKAMESVLAEASKGASGDAEYERQSSSSEMDFDDSEDGSDFSEEHDDKDLEDTFMESYSDALNKELSTTTLKKSFAQVQPSNNENEGPSNAVEADKELTPVDVDLNLVESFLNSFSSQQGLPGPATNLLGLMGVNVPLDAKKL